MKTILVVDDDKMNLNNALKILSPTYKVVPVPGGKVALNYLQKGKPDLILLDVLMPDMDGFETLTAIRKNADIKQDIPVVFLTADNEQSSIMKAASFGIHDFIVKPFIPKDLLARINKYFNL